MEEGFILSNKFRKIVFEEIASGERDVEMISRKNHIPPKIAKETVEELVEAGIVERRDNGYHLSREGERILDNLRNR